MGSSYAMAPRRWPQLWVLLVVACQHQPPPEPTKVVAAPKVPPKESSHGEQESLVGQARRMRTASACESFARSHLRVPDVAFAVLDACTQRDDFTEVRPFLRDPWLGITKKKGLAGLWLIARVLARNPATQSVDLELLRDSGLGLWPLAGSEESPEKYARRAVYFRGQIQRKGDRVRVVEFVHAAGREYEPSVRRSGDYVHLVYGKSRWHGQKVRREWRESGRDLVVPNIPNSCKGEDGEHFAMLVVVAELRTGALVDSLQGDAVNLTGKGSLVGCLRVSQPEETAVVEAAPGEDGAEEDEYE